MLNLMNEEEDLMYNKKSCNQVIYLNKLSQIKKLKILFFFIVTYILLSLEFNINMYVIFISILLFRLIFAFSFVSNSNDIVFGLTYI